MRYALPALTFLIGVAVALGASWLMRPAPEPGMDLPAVDAAIGDYLARNPESVVDAIRTYQERQQTAEQDRQRGALAENAQRLTADADDPVIGNPEGDVTVVEFFDYRCGYCKRVMDHVVELTENDPQLRVVFKEFPILGPESMVAARAALASRMQTPERYLDFHRALMAAETLDEERVMTIAGDLGFDTERLREDMAAPEVEQHIRRVHELAESLGIRGTPAFVVGEELIPGAVPLEQLEEAVDRAREAG